jgi:hypothetical protein
MAYERYHNEGNVDVHVLKKPLTFHFSKQTMNNRLFKASMGETLASWDSANIEASGIPTEEIIGLYKR